MDYLESQAKKGYWIDIKGDRRHVTELDDAHLLNCIKFVNAQDDFGDQRPKRKRFYLKLLADEAFKREIITSREYKTLLIQDIK